MLKWRYIFAVAALMLASMVRGAETEASSADIKAGLIVCDAGDMLYSTIGHAAIRMQSETHGLDYIYSYEGENVSQQVWTFLRGKLKMGMFAVPTQLFLDGYKDEGRTITEYPLQLNEQQKKALWRVLDERVKEGNQLPYDYFKRGCAISVVEMVNKALRASDGARIHYGPWPERIKEGTRRDIAGDAITNAPWQRWILQALIGIDGDRDCRNEEKLIVPQDLADIWQAATLDGHPLLGEREVLIAGNREQKPALITPAICIGLLLLLLIGGILLKRFGKSHSTHTAGNAMLAIIVSLGGILGLLMTWLICFSKLPSTEWSWLFVPFNILPIVLWPWRRYWAPVFAGIVGVWAAVMVLWPHLLAEPTQIAMALLFAGAVLALRKG